MHPCLRAVGMADDLPEGWNKRPEEMKAASDGKRWTPPPLHAVCGSGMESVVGWLSRSRSCLGLYRGPTAGCW